MKRYRLKNGQLEALAAPVVYFAHSMQIYGTAEATVAKAEIARLIPEGRIFDPENIDWKRLAKLHGQARLYESVIRMSDRVVVYEHKEHIGRGVAEEVQRAKNNARPVHALRGLYTKPHLVPVQGFELVDSGDWKIRYARLVCKFE